MKPIYKKYLTILGGLWGSSFVILLVAYLFLLIPQERDLNVLKKELKHKQAKYNIAKAASSDKAHIKLNQQLNQADKKLDTFVVIPDDLDDLTFDISRIANSMEITAFASQGTENESFLEIDNCEHIGYTRIEVNFKSSFNTFAQFINALERHEPVVFIDWFRIHRSQKDKLVHDTTLSLCVFIKKPLEENSEGY